jgi:hypothetical protein
MLLVNNIIPANNLVHIEGPTLYSVLTLYGKAGVIPYIKVGLDMVQLETSCTCIDPVLYVDNILIIAKLI